MLFIIYLVLVVSSYLLTRLFLVKTNPEHTWTIQDRNIFVFFSIIIPVITLMICLVVTFIYYIGDKIDFTPNNKPSKW